MTPDQAQRASRADPQDPSAALRYLTERMRLGIVSVKRVKAAAACGHPVAQALFPVEASDEDLPGLDLLNEADQRLFACDCAARVLPIYERKHPGDKRPRNTIEVACRFATGDADEEELTAARNAWDAAWDAARDAGDAAWSAAWAAARAATSSAKDAARDAARDAAWYAECAARDATSSAAWAWQRARLAQYLIGEIDGQ